MPDSLISHEDELLYLSRSDVLTIINEIDAVEQVRHALISHWQGKTMLPDEAVMRWNTSEGDEARSLVLQGMVHTNKLNGGLKVINANPGNVRNGQRRASGISMIFDVETAAINVLMEGAVISALRTAAVSALSVEACSSQPPSVVTFFGAGELCRAHAELFLTQFPSIQEIRIFDVEASRAERLVAELRPQSSTCSFTIPSGARAAVDGADVIVPVTTVTEPYIKLDWINEGATAVNVSLDDFSPEVILAAEVVAVDDWHLIVEDDRRLLGKMQRDGRFTWQGDNKNEQSHLHIGQILAGDSTGRLSENGLVYVNPFGLAIEDVAIAQAVYDYAQANGIGITLPR